MATAGQIVTRAFRENNLLGVAKAPTALQQAEALQLLSSMIDSMIGTEIARYLMVWPSPAITTAPVPARQPLLPMNLNMRASEFPYPPTNVRIMTKLVSDQTIYFQQFPGDGAQMALVNIGPGFDVYPLTLDGNGFLIEGQPQLVLDAENSYLAPIRWMFRADLGSWERWVLPLEDGTNMPFPSEFDDFFVAALAVRLSPNYKSELSDVTLGIARNGISNIHSRYFQDTPDANMEDPFVFNAWNSWGQSAGFFGGRYE